MEKTNSSKSLCGGYLLVINICNTSIGHYILIMCFYSSSTVMMSQLAQHNKALADRLSFFLRITVDKHAK